MRPIGGVENRVTMLAVQRADRTFTALLDEWRKLVGAGADRKTRETRLAIKRVLRLRGAKIVGRGKRAHLDTTSDAAILTAESVARAQGRLK